MLAFSISHKIQINIIFQSLRQEEAVSMGYQGVLWLYDKQNQVTEAGMMNVFFLLENEKGGNNKIQI